MLFGRSMYRGLAILIEGYLLVLDHQCFRWTVHVVVIVRMILAFA